MEKFKRNSDFVDYGEYSKFSYSGIYGIVNTINNKIYIGSSSLISRRVSKHFSELRNNRHTNKKLQDDYNKYGLDKFRVICLEETKELNTREVYYQLHYGIDVIYNEKITGVWCTEEYSKKLASSHKNTHRTKEYRDKMSKLKSHKIVQYLIVLNSEGKLINKDIKIYENMNEVITENPTFKPQPIRGVCNGSKKSAYGFQWRYARKDIV